MNSTIPKGATYELQRGYRMLMVPAVLAVAIFAIVPLAGMFGLFLAANCICHYNPQPNLINMATKR